MVAGKNTGVLDSFFWVVFSLCIVCIFHLSSVLYFPACTDVNGTVQPNCADVPLRIYSLTRPFFAACQVLTALTDNVMPVLKKKY